MKKWTIHFDGDVELVQTGIEETHRLSANCTSEMVAPTITASRPASTENNRNDPQS